MAYPVPVQSDTELYGTLKVNARTTLMGPAGDWALQLTAKSVKVSDTVTQWTRVDQIQMTDAQNMASAYIQNAMRPVSNVKVHELALGVVNAAGNAAQVLLRKDANNNGWVEASSRTYNASNTSDIVTIGSLQASTDVVHITGAETITGGKTFAGNVLINHSSGETNFGLVDTRYKRDTSVNTNYINRIYYYDNSNNRVGMVGSGKNGVSGTKNDTYMGMTNLYNASQYSYIDTHVTYDSSDSSYAKYCMGSWRATPGSNDEILTRGNGVTITTAQEISGTKTLYTTGYSRLGIRSTRTSGNVGGIVFVNSYNNDLADITGEVAGGIKFNPVSGQPVWINGQRTYNASNTTDIVTIGTLQGSTDVVHTSGNERVGGIKVFESEIRRTGGNVSGSSNVSYDIMRGYDGNNVKLWELCSTSRTDGTTRVYVNARKADASLKTIVLSDGQNDVGNDIVLTGSTGVTLSTSQTVSGDKNYTANQRMKDTANAIADTYSADAWFGSQFMWIDKNNARIAFINPMFKTNGKHELRFFVADSAGTEKAMTLSSAGYLIAPRRTYNASYTDDVVTIGALQASTDVVHTAGNENIGGVKTHSTELRVYTTGTVGFVQYNPSLPSSRSSFGSTSLDLSMVLLRNANSQAISQVEHVEKSTSRETHLAMYSPTNGGWVRAGLVDDGNPRFTVPSPSPTVSAARNIKISTSAPTSSDGNDGDIWIQY